MFNIADRPVHLVVRTPNLIMIQTLWKQQICHSSTQKTLCKLHCH